MTARLNLNQQSIRREYQERIIQFGEGNFLRAFINWMVQEMNNKLDFNTSSVVVVPTPRGSVATLNEQDGLFTLCVRGLKDNKVVEELSLIRSISRGVNEYQDFDAYLQLAEDPAMRFITSNTTEAGIAYDASNQFTDRPALSFPGKLTQLLFHRFEYFKGDASKGFIVLPCELIEDNGGQLKKIILQYADLWSLGSEFKAWIETANVFCNTLVDRIVPGYPAAVAADIEKEKGYVDKLVVEAEPFHLFVIEAPQWVKEEWPADKAGMNVLFVDNLEQYRTRKVRILNGLHTVMTPVAYLKGLDTVREAVEDPEIAAFLDTALYQEIIPTLDLDKKELTTFAEDVKQRFLNPFLKHALLSISLNSASKFKTRVLPSILEHVEKFDKLPENLCYSFAALLAFYRGTRGGQTIELKDDASVLALTSGLWADVTEGKIGIYVLVETILSKAEIWGKDLTTVNGLVEKVAEQLGAVLKTIK